MKQILWLLITLIMAISLLFGVFGCAKPALPPAPPPGPAAAPSSGVVYVDIDNAAGPWDGKSWATAYQIVQEGLDAADAGDEVWVAEGTYKPTATTDREISFQLKSGVALYGGFKGTETALDQRDWEANVTILSGDIGTPGDNSDNSYHVVVGANDAIIDGFTITGGNGTGPGMGPPPGGPGAGPPGEGELPPIHISPEIVLEGAKPGQGAGILNYQAAPTVRNCIITNNNAGKGGGVYNMCSRGMFPGRPQAGEEPPYPAFINCTFSGNHAKGRGGGAANDLRTHPTYIDCTFINNVCDDKGGGMYNDFGCSPTVTNCVFVGNSAVMAGAMGNDGRSCPTITNCTFSGNYASDEGAALYQGTGPANSPIVTNCIFWGNITPSGAKEIYNWHECNPVVTYSCVEGGYKGVGNIDADPLFADAEGGDYRLGPGSPCIDAGNGSVAPETDKDGNPRYDDKGRPDGPAAAPLPPLGPPGGPPPGAGPPPGGGFPPPPAVSAGPPVDMGAYERQEDTKVPAQDVVYVDVDNVAGPWDGKSWATAYQTIQEGLDYAYAAGAEVWVVEGTYQPTATTERTVSFQLRPGVALYGGFKGTETACDQRDWVKNVTILSGDIGIPGDSRDNSYHVVVGADDAAMDGFTITGGNADGEVYYGKGGGMVNYISRPDQGPFGPAAGLSPTLANCTFTRNSASEGGAMYNYDRCSPIVTNCAFTQNSADYGGAIYDNVGANTNLTNCAFTRNYAKWRGGAVAMDYGSRPTLTGCTFIENSTDGNGGAIYTISRASQLDRTSPTITNCTFSGNSAAFRGGGIANFDKCMIQVTDCTFTENYAGKGGGAISNDHMTVLNVSNCTFSGNSAGEGEADIDTDSTSSATVE